MTIANLMGHFVQILADYCNTEIVVEIKQEENRYYNIKEVKYHGESHTSLVISKKDA